MSDYAEVWERRQTERLFILGLLTFQLTFEGLRTVPAAKIIRLPADFRRHGRSSRGVGLAKGILNHGGISQELIFGVTSAPPSERAPRQKKHQNE